MCQRCAAGFTIDATAIDVVVNLALLSNLMITGTALPVALALVAVGFGVIRNRKRTVSAEITTAFCVRVGDAVNTDQMITGVAGHATINAIAGRESVSRYRTAVVTESAVGWVEQVGFAAVIMQSVAVVPAGIALDYCTFTYRTPVLVRIRKVA